MWGKGLIEGLVVTWKHFWGKKETFYYPEQKLPMTERFRGGHLVLDDKKCIGCKLCAMASQLGNFSETFQIFAFFLLLLGFGSLLSMPMMPPEHTLRPSSWARRMVRMRSS